MASARPVVWVATKQLPCSLRMSGMLSFSTNLPRPCATLRFAALGKQLLTPSLRPWNISQASALAQRQLANRTGTRTSKR